jgi:hypothetical protein
VVSATDPHGRILGFLDPGCTVHGYINSGRSMNLVSLLGLWWTSRNNTLTQEDALPVIR